MPHYIKYLQDTGYNLLGIFSLTMAMRKHYLTLLQKQLQDAFPNCTVRIVNRPSKKAVGINAVRTILDLCNFDEENTSEGWACCATTLIRSMKKKASFRGADHDTPWSHGADAMQTFALSLKPEKENEQA